MTSNEINNEVELFPSIHGDMECDGVTELESLCMNCYKNGCTRLMFTSIPYFKEIIISSFNCDKCGYDTRDVKFGGAFQTEGTEISLVIQKKEDLNRQVIKSEWAGIKLPEFDFEQPPNGKGEISTVEGIINSIISGLLQEQPLRKIQTPEIAEKIENFVQKLTDLKDCNKKFTFVIDDCSGNSYIQNPNAPNSDPLMKISHYTRTREHDISLGLIAEDGEDNEENNEDPFKKTEEVLNFEGNCPSCKKPCGNRMKLTDIPFFKQVVIMATSCDNCGFKDVEVKSGCGIEDKGTRITLNITDESDMTRDVLKSDTCSISIPHIDLHIDSYGNGKFTTLEGLLTDIRDKLIELNPFYIGDSAEEDSREKMQVVTDELNNIISGKTLNVTIILDDSTGNSYLQNMYAPDNDPEMRIEKYERTFDQDEDLGLNDLDINE